MPDAPNLPTEFGMLIRDDLLKLSVVVSRASIVEA
jgi:hypothetical protein